MTDNKKTIEAEAFTPNDKFGDIDFDIAEVTNIIQPNNKQHESMPFWYLSYATDEDGFKGGVIVQAPSFLDACIIASCMNINPGGQVYGVEIPKHLLPPVKYHDHILRKEDILEFWPDAASLAELEKE